MFKRPALFLFVSFVFTSFIIARSQDYLEEILSFEQQLLAVAELAKAAETKEKANFELLIEQIEAIKPYRWSLFLNIPVASARLFLISQKRTPKTMKLIEKVIAAMELKELPFVFVSRSADFFNAFAIKLPFIKKPFIVIGKALLEKLSDDELEALLAHELAHIKCEHTHKRLKLAAPFIALSASAICYRIILYSKMNKLEGFYFSRIEYETAQNELRNYEYQYFMSEAGSLVNALLSYGVSMKHSRKHEREADLIALNATGNPQALIDLMHRLEEGALAITGKELPDQASWFHTHPSCKERIAYITEEAHRMGIALG